VSADLVGPPSNDPKPLPVSSSDPHSDDESSSSLADASSDICGSLA